MNFGRLSIIWGKNWINLAWRGPRRHFYSTHAWHSHVVDRQPEDNR